MKRRFTSAAAFELATHAAVALDIDGGAGEMRRAERQAIAKAHALFRRNPQYARLKVEASTSKALRVSTENHHPGDQSKIRAAAKRRAEADRWIAEVKARKPGIPVKSGLHEGQRVKGGT